jgi:hypothetical protein
LFKNKESELKIGKVNGTVIIVLNYGQVVRNSFNNF